MPWLRASYISRPASLSRSGHLSQVNLGPLRPRGILQRPKRSAQIFLVCPLSLSLSLCVSAPELLIFDLCVRLTPATSPYRKISFSPPTELDIFAQLRTLPGCPLQICPFKDAVSPLLCNTFVQKSLIPDVCRVAYKRIKKPVHVRSAV